MGALNLSRSRAFSGNSNPRLAGRSTINFHGYGSYTGRYWLIGMEQGGGDSFGEIARRLSAWHERGRHELEDAGGYPDAIGVPQWFSPRPRLQPTWSKLIRLVLGANGQEPATEQVREYQGASLGRLRGDTCLLELLPLPSPSTSRWLYAEHSQLPWLADRQTYTRAYLAPRIGHLRKRIHEHRPQVVIFYSLGHREYWQRIADVPFREEEEGLHIGRGGRTLFIITKHPTTQGITNEYFHQAGRKIGAELRSGLLAGAHCQPTSAPRAYSVHTVNG